MRARPVPGSERPDSRPRALDHTRRPVAPESRAGSASWRKRSARERAQRQTRPTRRQSCCLPACPRLSPPRHTFPLSLAAARSHPVHLAHTPFHALPQLLSLPSCQSWPLPRAPSRTPTRAPGAPSQPCRSPGLRAAPGNPSPRQRPASACPAGGRSPGSRPERRGRGAQWRGGARSLTLGCTHARTNSNTDTRGVRCRRPPLLLLPPPP